MKLLLLALWLLITCSTRLLSQSYMTYGILTESNSKDLTTLSNLYNDGRHDPEQSYNIASQILSRVDENSDKQLIIAAYLVTSYYSSHLYSQAYGYSHLHRAYSLLTTELKQTHLGAIVIRDYGYYFLGTEQLDLALKFIKESSDILEGLNRPDAKLLYFNYTQVASIYTEQNKYDHAYNNYLKAIPNAKKQSKLLYSSSYNNIGLLFFKQNQFSFALDYYKKSKNILDLNLPDHKIFSVNVDENIANIFAETNRLHEASVILENVSAVRRSTKKRADSLEAIRSDVYRLNILSRLKKNAEAARIIEFIDAFYSANKSVVEDYENRTVENYYLAKISHYKRTNDYEKYLKYTPQYMEYKSKKTAYQKKILASVQISYVRLQNKDFEKKIKLENKLHNEEEESSTKKKYVLILIILLLAAGIIALLLLIKLRKSGQNKIELDTKITKLENENLAKIMETQQRDLINVIVDGEMRTNFQKGLLAKIEDIVSDKDQSVKDLFKPIRMEITSQISLGHRLTVLKSDISRVNANFDRSLLELCPDLSKTEREICSFIRLNLSIKEIAQIKGATTGSVKMLRSRIRKKMEIFSGTELDGYIQSI